MREIKFRVWYNSWMDYSGNVSFYNGKIGTFNVVNDFEENEPCHIVMQYTGLKDKNGKEIYEGDVVQFMCVDESFEKNIVVCGEHSAFDDRYVFEVGYYLESIDKKVQYPLGYTNELEVIGNIYENPELIGDLND